MRMQDIKHSFGSLWDTVTEGWSRLRDSAGSALTRFRPGETSNLPASDRIDDQGYVRAVVNEHQARLRDHSERLWALANVEIWHRIFIDGEAPGDVGGYTSAPALASAR